MWIVRGILLKEKSEKNCNSEREADAYKASLQVARHPSAQLGLLLARFRSDNSRQGRLINEKEILSNMSLYLSFTGNTNFGANLLAGLMTIKQGDKLLRYGEYELGRKIINTGAEEIVQSCEVDDPDFIEIVSNDILESEVHMSEIFVDSNTLIKQRPRLASKTVKSLTLSCAKKAPSSVELTTKDQEESNLMNYERLRKAQMLVRQNPECGESWLYLLKEVVKRISFLLPLCENDYSVALGLAARAKYILYTEIESNSVSAVKVSDTLALSSHLSDFKTQEKNKMQISDLQRALILDPENKFARLKMQSILK